MNKNRIKYMRLLMPLVFIVSASCSYRVERAPFFNEESAPAMPCLISGDTTLLIVIWIL